MSDAAHSRTVAESILKVLARATAEARAGNVEAVAVIIATPAGVPNASFGGESELVPTINMGADMLKAYLMGLVIMPKEETASGLVRPASGLDS
jgi:hypothetical protein